MSEKPVASIKTLARYEPAAVYIGTGEYVAECVRADDGDYYLAADADAAIEALQAEIERLREQLRLAIVDQAIAEAEANDVRRNAGVHVPGAWQPAAPDVEAMVEALEAALMVMTSKEVRLEKQADAITMVRSQLARLRDAVPAVQAPRACTCHPDDRTDGHCRERYAASECQALAAQAQAANADANMNEQIAAAIARAIEIARAALKQEEGR